jgi:hypothetical protein
VRGYIKHLSIQGLSLAAATLLGAWLLNGCASSGTPKEQNRKVEIRRMLDLEVGDVNHDMVQLVSVKPPKSNPKSKYQIRAERELNIKIWWWLN